MKSFLQNERKMTAFTYLFAAITIIVVLIMLDLSSALVIGSTHITVLAIFGIGVSLLVFFHGRLQSDPDAALVAVRGFLGFGMIILSVFATMANLDATSAAQVIHQSFIYLIIAHIARLISFLLIIDVLMVEVDLIKKWWAWLGTIIVIAVAVFGLARGNFFGVQLSDLIFAALILLFSLMNLFSGQYVVFSAVCAAFYAYVIGSAICAVFGFESLTSTFDNNIELIFFALLLPAAVQLNNGKRQALPIMQPEPDGDAPPEDAAENPLPDAVPPPESPAPENVEKAQHIDSNVPSS